MKRQLPAVGSWSREASDGLGLTYAASRARILGVGRTVLGGRKLFVEALVLGNVRKEEVRGLIQEGFIDQLELSGVKRLAPNAVSTVSDSDPTKPFPLLSSSPTYYVKQGKQLLIQSKSLS